MHIGIEYSLYLEGKINQLCQMAQAFLDAGHEVHFLAVTKKPERAERLMHEMQEKCFPHTSLGVLIVDPADDEVEETTKAFQEKQVDIVFAMDDRVCNRLNDRQVLAVEIH